MKRVGVILLLLLLFFGGWFLLMPARHTAQVLTGAQPLTNMPPMAARKQMSHRERLQWLEQNGEVPEDADSLDWLLAEQTSWWGKPIDAKKFWANRPLWSDFATKRAARRHGRFYPPIPYGDPSLSAYPYDEGRQGGGLDSPQHFVSSSEEQAFWTAFYMTHPSPPDVIEMEQNKAAKRYFLYKTDQFKISAKDKAYMQSSIRNNPLKSNLPPEAFTEEALFWVYDQQQRAEYQRLLGYRNTNGIIFKDFMSRVAIDPKYLTEPISSEQSKAADAWKVAYLQRLRREKADEQYIQAYLKAWNLSAADVFGETH